MVDSCTVQFLKRAISIPEGEGAQVKRLFPTSKLENIDPFVLLDEFYAEPPAGFPEHPHRGFEVVTYMLEGAFVHRDSEGNQATVNEGGVQRITTGKGIVHSEMPGAKGMSHGLQLWVNLPSRLKGINPSYQNILAEDLPHKDDEGLSIRTIVGQGSPVKLQTQVTYMDIKIGKSKIASQKISPGFNGFAYVLEGRLNLSSKGSCQSTPVEAHQAAVFNPGVEFSYYSDGKARFVLITGKPIGEPIKLVGSFVD
jgi:hypothetical protein